MASHSLRRASFLIFLSLVQAPITTALAHFTPNCTLPDPQEPLEAYFVKNPNVRGSLQIVWTCLLTLLVCVYQVIHLNIPRVDVPDESRAQWVYAISTEAKQIWRTIKWTIPIIIAPELILTESIFELKDARQRLRDLHKAFPDTEGAWTLTHMLYANMGGLAISYDGREHQMQGEDIPLAFAEHYLSAQPPITEAQIKDKSKDDDFTKGLAIVQIVYFYVEFMARWALDLPITQLELAVVSTGVYSFVSYFCLWHKPKGVTTSTVVFYSTQREERPTRTSQTSAVISRLLWRQSAGTDTSARSRPESTDSESDPQHIRRTDSLRKKILKNPKVASFGRLFRHGDDTANCWLAFLLTSVPLGAIHLCGWNFEFPSVVDLWLWRSSSLVATVTGPLIVVLAMALFAIDDLVLHHEDDADGDDTLYGIFVVAAAFLAFLYVVARLVLIVEMIRCLFFLPVGAFIATSWVMSIPHAG